MDGIIGEGLKLAIENKGGLFLLVAGSILGTIGTIFRDAVGAFFKWAWKKMTRKKPKVITGRDTMPERPKTLDDIDEEIERESREKMRALAPPKRNLPDLVPESFRDIAEIERLRRELAEHGEVNSAYAFHEKKQKEDRLTHLLMRNEVQKERANREIKYESTSHSKSGKLLSRDAVYRIPYLNGVELCDQIKRLHNEYSSGWGHVALTNKDYTRAGKLMDQLKPKIAELLSKADPEKVAVISILETVLGILEGMVVPPDSEKTSKRALRFAMNGNLVFQNLDEATRASLI